MAAPAAMLSVVVNAQTGPAVRGLARMNTALDSSAKKASRTTNVMKNVGKVGAVGVAVGLGFAVKKAADFEGQMSSLGSVSGATGREMEKFKKQALDAGAATKFSALDAAKAQTELAKGGLSVANIMAGGLKSALALAAAGEMDLADAAATTANAMNLFGLKGRDAMKVADMLATAANATTADVSDFAMALTQGGAVAKSAGLSLRETVLALEALAKAGTKNSDAGTSLKTAMIQLIKPTATQAELTKKLGLNFISSAGRMKNMSDISAMLRDKLGGMTKAQRTATLATLAGTDGVRTLTALYDAGPKKLDAWSKGLAKGGTAAEVAAKKQDNLKGKIENLMGSLETLAIIIGMKLIPWLSAAAVKVTGFLNEMQKGTGAGGQFVTVLRNIGTAFMAVVAPLASVVASVTKLGFAFLQTKAGMVTLAAVLGGLAGRLAFLAGAWAVAKVMAFTSAIGGAITMIRTAIAITTTLRAAMTLLAASMVSTGIGAFIVAIGVVAGALMGMKSKTDSAALSQTQFRDTILQTRAALDAYADASQRIKDANLAHEGATLGLKQAEANLQTLRRSGTATAQQLKQAEHDVAVAKNEVKRTTTEANRAQRDEGATKRKSIADTRELIAKLRQNSTAHRKNVSDLRAVIRGEGGWKLSTEAARKAQRTLRSELSRGRTATLALKREQLSLAIATGASNDKVNGLRREIARLESKNIKVSATVEVVNNVTGAIKDAVADVFDFSGGTGGAKDYGTGASGTKGPVEATIGDIVNRQMETADWKKILGPALEGGMGGGVAGGGSATLQAYKRISASMGLSAGSGSGQGFRPGDPGWHGKNRAFDSSGSAGAMMKFARHMFSRFGSNLLELIYTPMGKAIKNGQAVAPYAQADHHDHVHVAAAKGAAIKSHRATSPTVLFGEEAPRHPEYYISTNPRDKKRSTGLLAQATQEITGKRLAQFKKGGRRYPGAGFNWAYKNYPAHGGGGAALSVKQVRQVAEMAGFSPGRAVQMAQIARGESTYKPGADGGMYGTSGPPGYGLWQITPGAWGGTGREAIYNKFRSLGSRKGMFTPINNAKMAKFMYGQSGFGPWVGTQYLDRGMNVSGVASVLGANARSGGGGGTEAASPMSKRNRKILKRIPKRLKKIKGIGLGKKREGYLAHLNNLNAYYAEYAGRANSLGTTVGETDVRGKAGGHDEAYWLSQQLLTLWQLRETLIKYEAVIVKKRDRTTEMIESAKKFLRKLNKHPRRNKALIKAYKTRVIPALKKARSGLNTRRGELLGDEGLAGIQGIGSPMKSLKWQKPYGTTLGTLGGTFLEVQKNLRDLNAPAVKTPPPTPEVSTESADLLRTLLQQANLRTAVGQNEIANLPFAGSFAQGGIVPGRGPMAAVVHGGEAIGQPGNVSVQVFVHPNGDGADVYVNEKKVEAVVEKVTRNMARKVGRAPGARG